MNASATSAVALDATIPWGAAPSVDNLLAEAIAHLNAGQTAAALKTVEQIDHARDVGAVACTILGLIALIAGARDLSLAWVDKALTIDPRCVEAMKGRATVLGDSGRNAEADEAFKQAFRAGCVDPVAFYHHGNVLAALGRRDAAIAAYDQALQLRPNYPEALRAGGCILRDSGNIEPALRFFSEAVRLRPNYFAAVVDLANMFEKQDRQKEALATLDAGLVHMPGNVHLLNTRGVVLMRLGRLEDARAGLDLALAIEPTHAAAYLNRGQVEVRLGLWDDALASFETAVALRPHYEEALTGLGLALKMHGRFDEARQAIDEALRVCPTSVYGLTNRGELKLLLGDFEGGWPDYDFRFKTRGHERPELATPAPEWAGERNPGRVAIFADQAVGDIINFARYVPALRESGAEVTLICRPRMQRLLAHVSQGVRVVEAVEPGETFDYQIPLSSMPFACKTTERTLPNAPYIIAEPDLVKLWGERLGTQGFKIGLCWRGNQDWRSDPRRSVPLECLRPLTQIPGVRLVSLQMADVAVADAETLASMGVETLGPGLDAGPDGFIETAAVMANLDLVISCDTSLAHLAGALGRPTFALLQSVPEWRFMIGRDDSPWYPSMRLFRQIHRDDWTHPVAQVVETLLPLAASSQDKPRLKLRQPSPAGARRKASGLAR